MFWFKDVSLTRKIRAGVGNWSRDRERQGCRARAPKDGFMACPGTKSPPRRPPVIK